MGRDVRGLAWHALCAVICDARLQALHPIVAGNSRVTLVAAIAPAASAYLDTCNTLRLAARSQAITTRMLRNPSTGPLLDIPPIWDALPPEVRAVACNSHARFVLGSWKFCPGCLPR